MKCTIISGINRKVDLSNEPIARSIAGYMTRNINKTKVESVSINLHRLFIIGRHENGLPKLIIPNISIQTINHCFSWSGLRVRLAITAREPVINNFLYYLLCNNNKIMLLHFFPNKCNIPLTVHLICVYTSHHSWNLQEISL